MPTPITLYAARSFDNAIGRNNAIPWNLPTDLALFSVATRGKPVIMGRRTYQSLPPRVRPLPNRFNIIVTGQPELVRRHPDAIVAQDFWTALKLAQLSASLRFSEEICVIGGSSIYQEAMRFADKLVLTEVDTTVPDADTHFPDFNEDEWRETKSESYVANDRDEYGFTYRVLERISSITQPQGGDIITI